MKDPLFTVIITTYNRKAILPRAIGSVLAQTLSDLELLVVDNGSTDGTTEVVNGIKDGRLVYMRNPQPTASCDAPRNLGINRAKGRLIAFLDDDDIWYPRRLETVKGPFDARPDIPAVCHNENLNIGNRIDRILRRGPWEEDIHDRLLYEENFLSPSGMTIRADVLRALNGFDLRKDFFGAADYDLWLRMTSMGNKVFFIAEPLGECFVTGENWSLRNAAFDETVARIVQTHIMRHENRPLMQISARGMRRLCRLYAVAGRSYIRAGRFTDGLRCLPRSAVFVIRKPSLVFCSIRLKKKDNLNG